MKATALLPALLWLAASSAWPGSFYSQRPEDPQSVYVSPSTNGGDTAALQQAVNQVQVKTGQGLWTPSIWRGTRQIIWW